MSIVAELLQSTGKLAKENISLKVENLKRKFEDIQLEVQESLKSQYIDFVPQYLELDKLIRSVNLANDEYEDLSIYVEKEIKPQILNSVVEFNDVIEDLQKIRQLKEVAVTLCQQHNFLENAKRALAEQVFLKAAINLLEYENIKHTNFEQETDLEIASSLKTEFIVTKESLIYDLENAWHEKINISSSLEGRKKYFTIKIDKSADLDSNSEVLKSLKLLKNLRPVLKAFGKRFLCIICENVISNTVNLSNSEDQSTLKITIIKEHAPEPKEIFKIFKEIFNFMHDGIFNAALNLDEDESVFTGTNEFGLSIEDEFSTLLIEKCLKTAVPKHSNKLETFRDSIHAAEDFYNFLRSLGFFSAQSNKLMAFILDVDILPANKIAQEFLSRSRSCMEKDLYQTITVGMKPEPIQQTSNAPDLNEIETAKNGLSKLTFSLPQCQISESIKELISILNEIKEEAKNIGSAHAPKLYYVARDICQLYCCVVPVYHKEKIANIPQLTAIFHNNCMYFAHFLCQLGTHFESYLEQSIPLTFVDLVPEIRKLGAEAFLAQMRLQKHQLLQLLQEQACGNVLIDDSAVSKAEKSIRQCICQLQLLKKVWSDVLPVEVYFKAIGTLFNTCLEEIISQISLMEDIAAEAAAQLDSVFDIFLKQGPELFLVSSVDKRNYVHFYVKKWFKFQELQLILSASMREIVDRWASGKGPLADHFAAEEVKHLIRALFQNTERRAAALAKIK